MRQTRRANVPNSLRHNGFVIYEGPSRIDGAPIVVIATGRTAARRRADKGANAKTGAMVQTYILRADVHPMEAIASGKDASICGGCKHRRRAIVITKRNGQTVTKFVRTCYVNIGKGVTVVYDAWKRGVYPVASADMLASIGRDLGIRLGTYGDPAAVPTDVWEALLSEASFWTGYTHQWQSARLADTLRFCVASVDDMAQFEKARARGAGTFRVVPVGEQPLDGEIVCPASAEAGKRTVCADCRMCAGPNALNVVIQAHGPSRNFVGAQTARRALPTLSA